MYTSYLPVCGLPCELYTCIHGGGGSLGAHMQVAQHNSKESCWVALHGAVRCAACAIDIARPKPQRHRNSMHMLEQLCVHLQSRGYPLSRTSPARPFSARAARAQATGAWRTARFVSDAHSAGVRAQVYDVTSFLQVRHRPRCLRTHRGGIWSRWRHEKAAVLGPRRAAVG